jgi:transcriptional regulator with XRE-family HTH domain
VARMSLGDLTEGEVENIRTGATPNPSVDKVVALAEVFGVHPSYFLDVGSKPPILDREAMAILQDETISAIAHKSLHLPGREREMILGIIRQFENMQETSGDD